MKEYRTLRSLLGQDSHHKCTPSLRSRRQTVNKSQYAIGIALELTHGKPRRDQGQARSVIRTLNWILAHGHSGVSSLCHHWRSLALTGKGTLKGFTFRGKDTLSLFLASTLKRAIHWQLPASRLDEKAKDAEKRWMTPGGTLDPDIIENINEYLDTVVSPVLAKSRHNPSFPIPSDHGCIESTRKEGGVATQLRFEYEIPNHLTHPFRKENWELVDVQKKLGLTNTEILELVDAFMDGRKTVKMYQHIFRLSDVQHTALDRIYKSKAMHRPKPCFKRDWDTHQDRPLDLANIRAAVELGIAAGGMQDTYKAMYAPRSQSPQSDSSEEGPPALVEPGSPTDVSEEKRKPKFTYRHLEDLERIIVRVIPVPTPERIGKWLMDSSTVHDVHRHVKAIPLPERGGKVRVASLHNATSVHTARILVSQWLPVLKRMKVSKAKLTNKEVSLSTTREGTSLFSADMSAATDWITHDAAQTFWRGMCRISNSSKRVEDLGLTLLGPQKLNGEETRRGVHMGLGLSWCILSLMNDWAAWAAGAQSSDHAVCGDDLIGLWTPETRDLYQENLGELGIKMNKEKSFVGRYGVFCEDIIVLSEDGMHARSHSEISISQASGCRSSQRADFNNDLSILEYLNRVSNAKLTRFAKQTCNRLRVWKTPPGPLHVGGSGTGTPSKDLLAGFVLEGAKPLHGERKTKLELERKNLIVSAVSDAPRGGLALDDVLLELDYDQTARSRLEGVAVPERAVRTYSSQKRGARRRSAVGRRALRDQTLGEIISASSNLSRRSKRTARQILNIGGDGVKVRRRLANVLKPKQLYTEPQEFEYKPTPQVPHGINTNMKNSRIFNVERQKRRSTAARKRRAEQRKRRDTSKTTTRVGSVALAGAGMALSVKLLLNKSVSRK